MRQCAFTLQITHNVCGQQLAMWGLMYIVLFVTNIHNSACTLCPKQCDCDMEGGLNRAVCVDQNIVNIDVGVPKVVQIYSLSRNVISELDNFCFKEVGYTSLRFLDLSNNLIFWIGLHAFSNLDQLVHLDLSNNRLRFISSDVFWDTPQLEVLDLSANIFESLKNEPFIMHTKLQILNLNNCRIKSLPERLFMRLPNLKKLDLSENYFVTFSSNILRPLKKLERIELRNEYLICTPDFITAETYIASQQITYTKQCRKKSPKTSEKMISMVVEKDPVDIDRVWNITVEKNETIPVLKQNMTTLTPFEKFDKDFSAFQAFVIGLEIGLAIGVVGTYVWLRRFCSCGQLACIRPETRRRQRIHRIDGDMRSSLLWSNVVNPDLETPPLFRRQLSLLDRSPPSASRGLPPAREGGVHADAIRIHRAETPPPPYHECRINL